MSDRAGIDGESYVPSGRPTTRMRRQVRGDLLPTRTRPSLSGIGSRGPVSPDLTETQRRVLAALRVRRKPIAASGLTDATDLTLAQVRRALADLRELRLASADQLPRGGGNVWSATS